MLVVTGGARYLLTFHHDYEWRLPKHGKQSVFAQRCGTKTTCIVKQYFTGVDEPTLIAEEFAECHPDDQFNKEKGRKLALTRVLDVLFPPDPWDSDSHEDNRENRQAFWDVYLSRKGRPQEGGNR
jgi:hypothetical protein